MNSAYVNWRQSLLLGLFFILLAAILLSPFYSNQFIPNLWDIWNHLAAIAHAKTALLQGQFPLRVSPTEVNNWLYPQFQFYSPTSYTIAGFIYAWITPNNPFLAYKITLMFAIVLGGFYFYYLALWLVRSKYAALLAAVAYLTSPYYIIVINHVGGFNEGIALGILPAVVYYTFQRYFHPENIKTLLCLSLFWYLLATTHLITFFYTSLCLMILLVILTLKNRRHFFNLLQVGIGYTFGLMLALWYLAPVIFWGKYLAIARSWEVNLYAPTITSLLSPVANISSGVLHPAGYVNVISQIHPGIGFPILFALAVGVFAIFNHSYSPKKRAGFLCGYLAIVVSIFLVLVWSPINFWQYLPEVFSIFQYSWRLLSQVMWLGSLLFAWAIFWLLRNQLNLKITILAIILIISFASSWLPITERSFIDASAFFKKPYLITNTDSYVIDGKKYKKFLQVIDTMALDSFKLQTANGLQLNLKDAYKISKDLIDTDNLFISINGNLPKTINKQKILVQANGVPFQQFSLEPGVFHWRIPLKPLRNFLKKNNFVNLKFTSSDKNKEPIIPIENIEMQGFIKSSLFLSQQVIAKQCKQLPITTCQIQVPANTRLLELPVLYYPEMLSIELNGKKVPYFAVLYQKYYLAGIIPLANQINEVKIKFTGLIWANNFSIGGWLLWCLFWVAVWIRKAPLKIADEDDLKWSAVVDEKANT